MSSRESAGPSRAHTAMTGPYAVDATATLREGMEALNESGVEIVMVVDKSGRLVGTVTDGDVRRAILGGAMLDALVVAFAQRNFTAVDVGVGRAEVIELMQARRLSQIPIVDRAGKLCGLHVLHDVLGTKVRPNTAVVMAGGKGTRLGALTATTPKPMLKVAGRPILERIVLHLVSHGLKEIFLAVNYLSHLVEEHFGDGNRFGCRIRYLKETSPLGTGGALSLLPEVPTAPMLVMNGDLVTQANLGAMLDAHSEAGARATVGLRRYFHHIPFGCAEVDGGRVVSIHEKPTLTRLVNAGIYVLDPQVVARVPNGQDFALPSLLEGCLSNNEVVHGFEIEEDWIDVGQRDQLNQARGEGTQE